MRGGWVLLVGSVITRLGVVTLLCTLAWLAEYVNLKQAYNHPRLVELARGSLTRTAYEWTDTTLARLGDPLVVAQTNGGMTWSLRVLGVPFTDPVAALAVLAGGHYWELGFALGLVVPLLLALLLGRVFCSYLCPASLMFFAVARVRRALGRWFLFPEWNPPRVVAWGVLLGGLAVAALAGHGVWTLLLPYFAMGQTIFNGLAAGVLSVSLVALAAFVGVDVLLGRQFTCRHLCPTGRLLGWLGRRAIVMVRRDAAVCLEGCRACAEVCPMAVNPRLDQTLDCSLCGECLIACPTQCLRVKPSWHARMVAMGLLLFCVGTASAHHFKGLPHYNYFENYPQVPEKEFLGQVGDYEMSLVVYDFQGLRSEAIEEPESVRLFLVIFNLRSGSVYQGRLTLEILDEEQPVFNETFAAAELENLYATQRRLTDTGHYAVRLTLHEADGQVCVIPFRLSSQRIHWGRWVALGLVVLVGVTAVGARRARIAADRRAGHDLTTGAS